MSEGYSRVMKSASGKPAPKEDSFRELKEMVDKGYERFWDNPRRRMLKPRSPDFGCFDFPQTPASKEDGSDDGKFDCLT